MQFMFEFRIDRPLTALFRSLIPKQREVVRDLMHQGAALSYVLDLDKTRGWMTVCANSESEALAIIDELPLARYMRVQFHPVRTFRPTATGVPMFSEN